MAGAFVPSTSLAVRTQVGEVAFVHEPSRYERRLCGPLALVVDDDPRIARSLSRWLAPLATEAVRSVSAALPVIRGRGRLTLAFVDFDLPDGCGFGALREVARYQPDAIRVLMSGREGVQRFAGAARAHLFVPKPFEPSTIERIARLASSTAGLEY